MWKTAFKKFVRSYFKQGFGREIPNPFQILALSFSKFFEKLPETFVKLCNLSKNEIWQNEKLNMTKWKTKNDPFTSNFQGFTWFVSRFLFKITSNVEQIKSKHQKIIRKTLGQMHAKKENLKTLMVQKRYLPFLHLTCIHLV